jgi:thiamine-phosphate diphosphorylase
MKPLPRLLALTDDRVAAVEDLAQRAAALAAVGSAVGLVARLPSGTAAALTALARRFVALARPAMASVFVTGRADIAAVCTADGVVGRRDDLSTPAMRDVLAHGVSIGMRPVVIRSVHSLAEAEAAVADGADGLLVGTIWPSATHPGREGAGAGLIDQVARCGVPVWAIGGVSAARAVEARDAGAWGVASISAAWDGPDVNQAALALLAPWRTPEER